MLTDQVFWIFIFVYLIVKRLSMCVLVSLSLSSVQSSHVFVFRTFISMDIGSLVLSKQTFILRGLACLRLDCKDKTLK